MSSFKIQGWLRPPLAPHFRRPWSDVYPAKVVKKVTAVSLSNIVSWDDFKIFFNSAHLMKTIFQSSKLTELKAIEKLIFIVEWISVFYAINRKTKQSFSPVWWWISPATTFIHFGFDFFEKHNLNSLRELKYVPIYLCFKRSKHF